MLAARVVYRSLDTAGPDRGLPEEAGIVQGDVQANLASSPRDPTGSKYHSCCQGLLDNLVEMPRYIL
jgi:hypothetical protein